MTTNRVRLRRTAAGEVSLPSWVEADPTAIAEAAEVDVHPDAVDPLLATGEFVIADPGSGEAVLRGAELDEALAEAGLPRTGTADEKRQRLAEAHLAHQGAPDSDADGAGDSDDEQEQDR